MYRLKDFYLVLNKIFNKFEIFLIYSYEIRRIFYNNNNIKHIISRFLATFYIIKIVIYFKD